MSFSTSSSRSGVGYAWTINDQRRCKGRNTMTTKDTEMRMAYLATEHAPGGQLVIDAPAAYSIKLAHNGTRVLGPSATLATTRTFLASVDPTITSAAGLRVSRRFDSVRETVRHYDHFTNASRRLSRFWRVSHLLLEQRYGTWVAKAESETVRQIIGQRCALDCHRAPSIMARCFARASGATATDAFTSSRCEKKLSGNATAARATPIHGNSR